MVVLHDFTEHHQEIKPLFKAFDNYEYMYSHLNEAFISMIRFWQFKIHVSCVKTLHNWLQTGFWVKICIVVSQEHIMRENIGSWVRMSSYNKKKLLFEEKSQSHLNGYLYKPSLHGQQS